MAVMAVEATEEEVAVAVAVAMKEAKEAEA